ncbi:unnamed protein product [Amoebophrya sp. A120]|nr:unnamed protein product [Amoebophrya sp. A120]|eukprot:GSA120T00001971001.1
MCSYLSNRSGFRAAAARGRGWRGEVRLVGFGVVIICRAFLNGFLGTRDAEFFVEGKMNNLGLNYTGRNDSDSVSDCHPAFRLPRGHSVRLLRDGKMNFGTSCSSFGLQQRAALQHDDEEMQQEGDVPPRKAAGQAGTTTGSGNTTEESDTSLTEFISSSEPMMTPRLPRVRACANLATMILSRGRTAAEAQDDVKLPHPSILGSDLSCWSSCCASRSSVKSGDEAEPAALPSFPSTAARDSRTSAGPPVPPLISVFEPVTATSFRESRNLRRQEGPSGKAKAGRTWEGRKEGGIYFPLASADVDPFVLRHTSQKLRDSAEGKIFTYRPGKRNGPRASRHSSTPIEDPDVEILSADDQQQLHRGGGRNPGGSSSAMSKPNAAARKTRKAEKKSSVSSEVDAAASSSFEKLMAFRAAPAPTPWSGRIAEAVQQPPPDPDANDVTSSDEDLGGGWDEYFSKLEREQAEARAQESDGPDDGPFIFDRPALSGAAEPKNAGGLTARSSLLRGAGSGSGSSALVRLAGAGERNSKY